MSAEPARHRWPAFTLRRQLVLAFPVLITVAVVLVGGISYSATRHTYNQELDRSLALAAATIAAGGTVTSTGAGDGDRGQGRSSPDAVISVVQHLAADGTVTEVSGDGPTLPVNDAQRQLALTGSAGTGRYDQVSVQDEEFRVYTLAQGQGKGAIQVGRDLEGATRVLTSIALATLAAGLGVILAGIIAGWWIARRITRRLSVLSAAAEKVAVSGDLAVPIEAGGRDEVGRLAGSLRAMLAQLGESRAAQQRLVQNAGHELRTPVTSLRTNARVLRRFDELPPDSRTRLMDDIDGELFELTALVNELVELATDSYSAETPEPTALGALADRVADRVRRRTGRSVVVEADDSVAKVRPHAVERAIGNLVENAVKFDPHGRASIEVVVEAARIEVRDRGPGVADEDLARVFDRFYRTDTARSFPGSGLGLSIVQEVAVQHEGTVSARNRPGGGLVMTIAFPSAPPPSSAAGDGRA